MSGNIWSALGLCMFFFCVSGWIIVGCCEKCGGVRLMAKLNEKDKKLVKKIEKLKRLSKKEDKIEKELNQAVRKK